MPFQAVKKPGVGLWAVGFGLWDLGVRDEG